VGLVIPSVSAAALGAAPVRQSGMASVSTGNVAAASAEAPAGLSGQVSQASSVAFVEGLNTILLVAAILALGGALLAALLVRERRVHDAHEAATSETAREPAAAVAG
jgi:hypothetical protein